MRLILLAAPMLALAACADVETDGDTAIDTIPDSEEVADLPEDYEPATRDGDTAMPTELDEPVDASGGETPGDVERPE
ncbi:hypothetical protein [Sphingomicrobium sediminis]|uniref:Secreted protein n=1 Tax=Sphingomicrobium sediminis TaxID=2950949 RepID=A0A9X2J281_9SPHN|nr:hypothetical protein [Sphingomicrobium sediminis]MCM8558008.1 hypothetical protein [Sphingomicrobium sediminis]